MLTYGVCRVRPVPAYNIFMQYLNHYFSIIFQLEQHITSPNVTPIKPAISSTSKDRSTLAESASSKVV